MSHQIQCSKRIKLALIDLNGTCHIGNKLINQSNVAIRKLINSGVAVRYVTNTTKESTFSIAKRCKELDLWDERISIHTCIDATVRYLNQEKLTNCLIITKWKNLHCATKKVNNVIYIRIYSVEHVLSSY